MKLLFTQYLQHFTSLKIYFRFVMVVFFFFFNVFLKFYGNICLLVFQKLNEHIFFLPFCWQYYIFAYVDAPGYQILKNLNIISTGVLYRIILKKKWVLHIHHTGYSPLHMEICKPPILKYFSAVSTNDYITSIIGCHTGISLILREPIPER